MYIRNDITCNDFQKAMQVKSYAANTIDNYSYYLSLFLEHTNKSQSKINSVDVRKYMNDISCCNNSVKNQSINAIKLLFKYVLGKKIDAIVVERPRKTKQLPRVIDSELIEHKLSQIKNLKHKAILELGYRCGLRVSEVCNLMINDIDSSRMLILIRNSKGNKDRYVPMSKSLLRVLRLYFKQYKPKEYLFNGQRSTKYSRSSCQKVFKKYIDNKKSFHTLRHSGLTAMMERGVNLRIIQKVAGHASSKTTEIYTHVSRESILQAAL